MLKTVGTGNLTMNGVIFFFNRDVTNPAMRESGITIGAYAIIPFLIVLTYEGGIAQIAFGEFFVATGTERSLIHFAVLCRWFSASLALWKPSMALQATISSI